MSYFAATRAALARRGRVEIFFRDDCVGWGDDQLFPLCDLFASRQVPLDLAVIPTECSAELVDRVLAHPADLRIHQLGYAHVNHEVRGETSEFGDERLMSAVTRDIVEGHRILTERFGDRVEPVFTAPWNRCRSDIAVALRICELSILSRDFTATRATDPAIVELPVAVDASRVRDSLDDAIAAALNGTPSGQAFGFQLSHLSHDAFDRTLIGALLDFLLSVSTVRLLSMADASVRSVAA